MERYFGALTIALPLAMVLIRGRLMRGKGVQVMHFGKIDKEDFLIPPFALFYFYTVFAAAFNLPLVSRQEVFPSAGGSWAGVFICFTGLLLMVLSAISDRDVALVACSAPMFESARDGRLHQ